MPGNDQAARRVRELDGPECWKLLASVPVGRVVFTQHALPAIRAVNHLVDDGVIIIRSHEDAAIVGHAAAGGAVVCYEADQFDTDRRTGWSVVVTGLARPVRDPDAAERYRHRLEPWFPGDMDHVIAIEPGIVTGRRLTT